MYGIQECCCCFCGRRNHLSQSCRYKNAHLQRITRDKNGHFRKIYHDNKSVNIQRTRSEKRSPSRQRHEEKPRKVITIEHRQERRQEPRRPSPRRRSITPVPSYNKTKRENKRDQDDEITIINEITKLNKSKQVIPGLSLDTIQRGN